MEPHCESPKIGVLSTGSKQVFWSPDIERARLFPLPGGNARCAASVTMNSLRGGLLGAIYANDWGYGFTPTVALMRVTPQQLDEQTEESA